MTAPISKSYLPITLKYKLLYFGLCIFKCCLFHLNKNVSLLHTILNRYKGWWCCFKKWKNFFNANNRTFFVDYSFPELSYIKSFPKFNACESYFGRIKLSYYTCIFFKIDNFHIRNHFERRQLYLVTYFHLSLWRKTAVSEQ